MTHRELVQKAREAGLTQCKGAFWRNADGQDILTSFDNVEKVAACCELGLLRWGFARRYLTLHEFEHLNIRLVTHADASIGVLNDERGMTWEQFTDLIER